MQLWDHVDGLISDHNLIHWAGGRLMLNSPSSCMPGFSRPDSDGDTLTKKPNGPEAGAKATVRTSD